MCVPVEVYEFWTFRPCRRALESTPSSLVLEHGDLLVVDSPHNWSMCTVRSSNCKDLGLTSRSVGYRNTFHPVHLQALSVALDLRVRTVWSGQSAREKGEEMRFTTFWLMVLIFSDRGLFPSEALLVPSSVPTSLKRSCPLDCE